jgi:hypothetical protein
MDVKVVRFTEISNPSKGEERTKQGVLYRKPKRKGKTMGT